MNKQRYEALEQLFLNAGVILYKRINAGGAHFNYKDPDHGMHFHNGGVLQNWVDGDAYDYRGIDKKLRRVEVDTLKDALLCQDPNAWVHRTIVVEEPKPVVCTTDIETTPMKDQVPEGATHYRNVSSHSGKRYYKFVDDILMFYSTDGNWYASGYRGELSSLHYDDPTKAASDSKWVTAFQRGEAFARSGLDVMSNPYTTDMARQEFFAGYAAYQRRTHG